MLENTVDNRHSKMLTTADFLHERLEVLVEFLVEFVRIHWVFLAVESEHNHVVLEARIA